MATPKSPKKPPRSKWPPPHGSKMIHMSHETENTHALELVKKERAHMTQMHKAFGIAPFDERVSIVQHIERLVTEHDRLAKIERAAKKFLEDADGGCSGQTGRCERWYKGVKVKGCGFCTELDALAALVAGESK